VEGGRWEGGEGTSHVHVVSFTDAGILYIFGTKNRNEKKKRALKQEQKADAHNKSLIGQRQQREG